MAEGDLAATFRRLIASSGPISITQYMGESNLRYYNGREPFGTRGDFVTAPEISQMFGELIGLWLADLWLRAAKPEPVHYVELGPGRGVLARDALRTMRRHGLSPTQHLVEGSARLRELQREAVPQAVFHDDLSQVPEDGPVLVVANEFLDALPLRQLVRTEGGWREVMVGLAGEGFSLIPGTRPMDAAVPASLREAPVDSLLETCPGAAAVVGEVARRLARQGGAALFIDYGHAAPRFGSTLQAVRNHEKVGLFDAPGKADLSAHVDFDQMRQVAQAHGARWMGTVTQGTWLRALGIDQRARALASSAPQHRDALLRARDRLVEADEMGELFKVMGLGSPQWPEGAGFPPP